MQLPNILLLQSNPGLARILVTHLHADFDGVRQESSLSELRRHLSRESPQTVILDLEMASISDVEVLVRDSPAVHIVCTHRLADEKMWTAALGAGADDCCLSGDISSILKAVRCHAALAYQAAA